MQSCLKKHADRAATGKRKTKQTKVFHLVVEDPWTRMYWLQLLVPANVTLAHVDQFLREIWLECCHHLSAFTIDNRRYNYATTDWAFGGGDAQIPTGLRKAAELFDLGDFFDELDERDMNVKLEEILRPKLQFTHEYDFGTTTELVLKVISQMQAPVAEDAIYILARNDPPDIRCQQCDKPATSICTQCMYDDEACFCNRCAKKHGCDEEMLLPVVNSPRMGMCGYTGPAT
jgi:hypothetical protein